MSREPRGCDVDEEDRSVALPFISAVEVGTAGGLSWTVATFHTAVGPVEAVYREGGGRISCETAYRGTAGYWDAGHPFWGSLIVLSVRQAAPVRGLTIPAAILVALGIPESRGNRPRPLLQRSAGGEARRVPFVRRKRS